MPTPILDTAEAWWHADLYDPDVDGETWPDQSGNGYDLRLGSTAGADTNDPLFRGKDTDDGQYCASSPDSGGGNGIVRQPSSSVTWASITTGTIDVRVLIEPHEIGVLDVFWSIRGDSGQMFRLAFSNTDSTKYKFFLYDSGGTQREVQSTANHGCVIGEKIWVRVEWIIGTSVTFYESTNGTDWTQVGSNAGTGWSKHNTGNSKVFLFNWTDAGAANQFIGKIWKFEARHNGTLKTNIDFTNEALITPATFQWTEEGTGGDTMELEQDYTISWGPPVAIVKRNLFMLGLDDYFQGGNWFGWDQNSDYTIAVCHIPYRGNGGSIGNPEHLFSKRNSAGSPAPGVFMVTDRSFNAGSQGWIVGNSGGNFDQFAGIGILEAQTHIYRRRRSDTTLEIFEAGASPGSTSESTQRNPTNTLSMRIGATAGTAANYCTRPIIGAAVFQSALSDADILALHAELISDLTPAAGGNVDLVRALRQEGLAVGTLGMDSMLAGSQARKWR